MQTQTNLPTAPKPKSRPAARQETLSVGRPEEVIASLRGLTKGKQMTYHEGDLAADRCVCSNTEQIARAVTELVQAGKVALRQIRNNPLRVPLKPKRGEKEPRIEIVLQGYQYIAVGL